MPRIALLTALACVLQVGETFLPHPFPWVRLGLANMIALVALFWWGWREGLFIAASRTVIASLIVGTFLGPAFLLSFSGAVSSVAVMALLSHWAVKKYRVLGVIGVSVAGAVAHNYVQLALAIFLFTGHPHLWYFAPYLTLAGILTGCITGWGAQVLMRSIPMREPI